MFKKEDWKKGDKVFENRIDREAWKRIDPSLVDHNPTVINCKAEDERRLESDCDASLLNEKAKLPERDKLK